MDKSLEKTIGKYLKTASEKNSEIDKKAYVDMDNTLSGVKDRQVYPDKWARGRAEAGASSKLRDKLFGYDQQPDGLWKRIEGEVDVDTSSTVESKCTCGHCHEGHK